MIVKADRQNFTFKVPLTRLAHQIAQQFYHQHSQPQKAKQVYLNTLAVYAVDYYLKCFGIETDLATNDSWNPVMQTLADIADLVIKDRGKIECRPVLPDSATCHVPAEVWSERIGYVALRLDRSLTEATLLGFVKQVETEELPIANLEPLDELPAYLEGICVTKSIVRLQNWFDRLFESGWQSLELLLASPPENLAFGVRTGSPSRKKPTVTGAKLLDLGMQLGDRSVVLLVIITPEKQKNITIEIQVHPVQGEKYLPPNLKLALLSEAGETLREVRSRPLDNFIQLPSLKCHSGESFQVEVALDDVSIIETFAI